MIRSHPTHDASTVAKETHQMTAPPRLTSGTASLAVLLAATLLLAPTAASAASPGPGFSIDSVAEPTDFNSADTQNAVQVIAVLATGGTYKLSVNGGEAASELSGPIAWNAGAQELQQALEAVPDIGPGNVVVTGGPGDETGSHPYRLEYVGSLSGQSEHLLPRQVELNSPAAQPEVRQEEAQDVYAVARDRYALIVANVGSRPSEGTITVADTLPAGVQATGLEIHETGTNENGECLLAELKCTYEKPLVASHELIMYVDVAIASPSLEGPLANHVTVSGGNGAEVSATQTNPVNTGPASFGIAHLGFAAVGPAGAPDAQAGDHPYGVNTAVDLNTVLAPPDALVPYEVASEVKEVPVELPLGFLGDPLATERCPEVRMTHFEGSPERGNHTECPTASQVGVFTFRSDGGDWRGRFPVYDIVPEHGYPAELGFNAGLGQPIFLYATVVPGASGYRLRVSASGVLRTVNNNFKGDVEGFSLTVFGNPAEHDGYPGNAAFLTNPTRCTAEPLTVHAEATAWEGGSATAEATAYPQLTGCGLFQGAAVFSPSLAVTPETTQADTPAAYRVDLKVPQAPNVFGALATPYLKDTTVTLPEGVSVNPASADGLAACQVTGPEGINIEGPEATEVGEGHPDGNSSPYDDGLIHAAPGHCPAASTLGTVEATTPVLEKPVHGHIYLGTPDCSPCRGKDAEEGKLIKLYMELNDPTTGVIVKLAGQASIDPATGQLTGSFRENPQFPIEEVNLRFKSGPRAALVNPQTCGTYTTTSDLKPWSAPESGPDATPSDSFQVASGPAGGACAKTEAEEPNSPGFEAGTQTPIAGAYSPFVLKLSRADGSQRIHAIDTTLPPGLLGKLAGVGECSEAQLAAAANHSGAAEKASPSCPLSSEVGTVNVGAGAGPNPFYVQGHAYLAGPYKGAPLSLAILTPALAGPFDLGTVVVRTALYVDPETARITAKSDPIPTILAGIPLDVRDIRLNMDRPNFTRNPTSCNRMAVTGNALSVLGQLAPLIDRFQVGACNALGFKPSLSLKVSGGTHRGSHPALRGVLKARKGDANIARAAVSLPHSEFLDQGHIGTVCTRVQFAEGQVPGERCPPASIYGHARAITPLLDHPLEGPVYLRSSSHKLPDLVAALNGQINVDLVGRIDSVRGGIRNTFEVLPDAPVSKFVLEMAGGKKSLLVNSTNLCAGTHRALADFTGHNGKIHDLRPPLKAKCGKGGKGGKKHKSNKPHGRQPVPALMARVPSPTAAPPWSPKAASRPGCSCPSRPPFPPRAR